MSLVKVCGLTNLEDALVACENGAAFLGFVFAESPRQVDIETVRNIYRVIGGDVRYVGVFTEESDYVLRAMDEAYLDFAQLHGNQSEEFACKIGRERVIRALRVKDESTLDELYKYECAKYYLLDTYKKGVPGGTGETFDWQLAVRAKSWQKPLFLSGGLSDKNVADAVAQVSPFAVDASSLLEASPGVKDHEKLKEFCKNARSSTDGA